MDYDIEQCNSAEPGSYSEHRYEYDHLKYNYEYFHFKAVLWLEKSRDIHCIAYISGFGAGLPSSKPMPIIQHEKSRI